MSQLLELERRRNKMNELTAPSPFCPPHYIEELGCDGLTAEEIATSLSALVGDVRRKLREDKNETLKSLKVVISKKVNINGLEYEEFFLSTAAAKFFVARYENDIGDGYLEYLIRLDMAVEKRLRAAEHDLLIAEAKALKLEAKLKTALLEDNEPVTEEEYDLLNKLMRATLKRYGKQSKIAYKVGFCREVMEKFYLPGEEDGTCTYLPRKNFKAAITYARRREFDLSTTKEFTL
jgi:hypothetical protein